MSLPPPVSVIVVNFNRVNLLRACLDSLARQEKIEAEWIVVDNGSSDGSAAMVASEFPQAKLIRSAVNLGFCAGNNLGIAAAQGEFVALLNNDAVADPLWLSAMAAEMTDRRVGMVASKILVAGRTDRTDRMDRTDSTEVIDKIGHGIYWDGQNRGRGSGQLDRGQYDSQRDILWPDGCAALYRKNMLDQVGGFDEDFFAYADDAELGLRARSAGWTARYAPSAVVHHLRGATMGKRNLRRIQLIERNRIWLATKHFPLWLLLLNPYFYLLRLIAGFLAALAGQGEAGQVLGFRAKLNLAIALLAADWEALRGIPNMWAKRRAWRTKRKWNDSQVFALLRKHRLSLTEISKNVA